MSLRLADPLVLLALIPVAAVALLFAKQWPWGWSSSLRVLAAVLLVLALAQPQVGGHDARLTVLAVDRSASIDANMAATERRWEQQVARVCPAPCRIVEFAQGARSRSDQAGTLPAKPSLSAAGSDLEAGVRLALRAVPQGGRIALLSDGNQTEGDVLAAGKAARAAGVQVDAVPLADPRRRDAAITRIAAPQAVHAGDPIPLMVTIRSSIAAKATLYLTHDDQPAGQKTLSLHAGDTPLLLSYTASSAGWQSYTARVALSGDSVAANDSSTAVIDVKPEPRLLLVGGNAALAARIARLGFALQRVAPAALPTAEGGYAGLDGVVLGDVPAASIGSSQVTALGAAIRRRGLGLVVLGGPDSFSGGGYAGSSLEGLLPVASRTPGSLQRRNAAIELVLDRSGSMIDLAGGVPKIAMVRQGGVQTARYLAAHRDELGVIAFDAVPHRLIPLQPLSPGSGERSAIAAIDGLTAEGGTNIFLALQAGFRQVQTSDAPAKHIVLITDGVSEAENYGPLLQAIRQSHVSVATVALGAEANRSLLARIAHATGGAAYATETARSLPRIFAKESRFAVKPVRLAGSLTVVPGSDSPIVASLAGQALPRLSGDQITSLKAAGAQADLLVEGGSSGSVPALAQWQLGAGRVAVWTPGIGGPWANAWNGQGKLWNDMLRWSERPVQPPTPMPEVLQGTPPQLRVRLPQTGNGVTVPSSIAVRLTAADGRQRAFTLTRGASGLYSVPLGGLRPGAYAYLLSVGSRRSSGELAVPYSLEYLPLPPAATPLGALAAATGGRLLAQDDPRALLSGRPVALWWALALAALVSFASAVLRQMLGSGEGSGGSPSGGDWRGTQEVEDAPSYAASSPSARAPEASSLSGSTSVGASR